MANKKHLRANFIKEEVGKGSLTTNASLEFLESKARFSLSKCSIGGNFCLKNVAASRALLSDLYRTFSKFESLTWHEISRMPHQKGISIERKDGSIVPTLNALMPETNTFGHFRVSSQEKNTFRVFGGRKNDLFYILYFDVDGTIHH